MIFRFFRVVKMSPESNKRKWKCHFNPLMHDVAQNGQSHFKNLAAFAARFLKCVRPFWDIMH